jgi:hypothetical protein
MSGRELGTALLIGSVSGVVVVIMAAALSGTPIAGFMEPTPDRTASPRPSRLATPIPPTASASARITPAPSSRPTPFVSSQPAPTPSPAPPTALTFEQPGVKAGLETPTGGYGSTTPAVARGEYISWRVVVGPAGAGQAVDVEVATRLDGTWTGWSTLTTRVADVDGIVVFSWRQVTPAWISVRFAHGTTVSRALQGRWR